MATPTGSLAILVYTVQDKVQTSQNRIGRSCGCCPIIIKMVKLCQFYHMYQWRHLNQSMMKLNLDVPFYFL